MLDLTKIWPRCFSNEAKAVRLLKIGIRNDLITTKPDGVSNRSLDRAIQDYIRSRPYRVLQVTPGSERIDLNGNVVGVLTEADVEKIIAIRLKDAERDAAKSKAAIEARKAEKKAPDVKKSKPVGKVTAKPKPRHGAVTKPVQVVVLKRRSFKGPMK